MGTHPGWGKFRGKFKIDSPLIGMSLGGGRKMENLEELSCKHAKLHIDTNLKSGSNWGPVRSTTLCTTMLPVYIILTNYCQSWVDSLPEDLRNVVVRAASLFKPV